MLSTLTNENIAASMEPRWTLKYLLLCKMGFWYHGIFTDFMERDFCECRFDSDLRNRRSLVYVDVSIWIINTPSSWVDGRCWSRIWGCRSLPSIHFGMFVCSLLANCNVKSTKCERNEKTPAINHYQQISVILGRCSYCIYYSYERIYNS